VTRLYLGLQANFLERMERKFLPRMSLNIAVSPDDEAELARLSPSARLALIPNGVDTEYFGQAKSGGVGLVFVGGTNWFPNRDALEWFVAEVLPLLRLEGYHDPVTWVGFCGEEERRRYGAVPGLTLTGYVGDVRPYLAAAAAAIVPLRMGGGTRLKVLDAWSMGKPVVSTAIGCEGLATRPGTNILVADTPRAFADAILQVARDVDLQRRLGNAARATVEGQYAWTVIGEKLRTLYFHLIQRSSPPVTLAASSLHALKKG
jgi:glycosyltransferase involved in cell wall biosynthesis